MLVCILGMPGSGKTTLGKNIATRFGFQHISAGDVARHLAESNEDVKKALDAGELAPREEMNEAMRHVVNGADQKNIIVDGYPRYADQLLDVQEYGPDNAIFLILSCDEETALERLSKRGRSDDLSAQIKQRIETYREETEPLFDDLLQNDNTSFVTQGTPIEQFNEAAHFLTMACGIAPAQGGA